MWINSYVIIKCNMLGGEISMAFWDNSLIDIVRQNKKSSKFNRKNASDKLHFVIFKSKKFFIWSEKKKISSRWIDLYSWFRVKFPGHHLRQISHFLPDQTPKKSYKIEMNCWLVKSDEPWNHSKERWSEQQNKSYTS